MKNISIGIDLGTTYSCVGALFDGKIQIIPNSEGERTTPSYVSYVYDCDQSTTINKLVGMHAKQQLLSNPKNTIYDNKRIIGRNYDSIGNIINHLPYDILNINNKVKIKIYSPDNNQFFVNPEEISAMILSKIKSDAENYIGTVIVNAVITVPAYFNDAQRQATKDAAEIAGLNVIRIINEPTAAALAYGLDNKHKLESKTYILVYDFGGGTLDCTILSLCDGVFEVIGTSGNNNLGGGDIDSILVDYCVNEFNKKHHINIFAKDNIKPIQRLRVECERAKRVLSSSNMVTISIDSLFRDIDFSVNISRMKMNDLCKDLFKKAFDPIDRVLNDTSLKYSDISEVIMVGGSIRIPKIRELIEEKFGKDKLNFSLNPDEAIAYGAAIQAANLSDESFSKEENILLLDVTPLSLGIETSGGVFSTIIEKNTTIPCKKSKIFSTQSDNQTNVRIKIYECDSDNINNGSLLGEFCLCDIKPNKRGVPKIKVIFEIDSNGILNVKGVDKTNSVMDIEDEKYNNNYHDQNAKSIVITNNKKNLSNNEVRKIIRINKLNELLSKNIIDKKTHEEIISLENLLDHIMREIYSDLIGKKIGEADKIIWIKIHNNTIKFIDMDIQSGLGLNLDVYTKKRNSIESLWEKFTREF